jgi:general stress protein 26
VKKFEQIAGELIKKAGFFMIGSVDNQGFPNMKAVLKPRKTEGIKIFYFTTNTSSMRVDQYRSCPKSSVYFCDPMEYKGIMLRGRMRVLEDADSKKMIWREGDEMYYPEGVADPDYCVLEFTAIDGRSYHDFKTETFKV